MLLQAALAYAHLVAILSLVVFISSEAALCRVEWMSAAVVQRLARVDRIYQAAALATLATGIARTVWGMKGFGWYWGQPLLYAKLALFVAIGLMSIGPARTFERWRRTSQATGGLPPGDEIRATRRTIIVQAHLLVLIPLAAVLLARGIGTR